MSTVFAWAMALYNEHTIIFFSHGMLTLHSCTDKKEKKISSYMYKEIQSGAVAESYMRKGFLIFEEMCKYFPIYEEAVSHI